MKRPHFFVYLQVILMTAGWRGIQATTYLAASKNVFYITDFSVECNSKLEKLLKAAYR